MVGSKPGVIVGVGVSVGIAGWAGVGEQAAKIPAKTGSLAISAPVSGATYLWP